MSDDDEDEPKAARDPITSLLTLANTIGIPSNVINMPPMGEMSSSAGESTSETLRAMLEHYPDLAQMEYETQAQYLPMYAQLASQMAGQVPGQLETQLDLERQYRPLFQELSQAARTGDLTSQMGDIAALTPQLDAIRRSSEGETVSGMRQTLAQQLAGDLAMGGTMTPEERRDAEQFTRSAQFSRGMGSGGGSANREAVAMALEGRRLKSERQGKASQFLSQDFATRYNPFSTIAALPGGASSEGLMSMSSPMSQPAVAGQQQSPLGTAMSFGQMGQTQQGINQSANQYNLQMQLAAMNAANQGIPVVFGS
jgi:hypothetical protein